MTTFAVITPTIGTPHLAQCIQSLKDQDCIHHLFVDGAIHFDRISKIADQYGGKNLRMNILHDNVGKAGGNFYGHRVYAAASYLVNQDVLCYLDEDNWVNSFFIRAYEEALRGVQWAYTLRTIYSKEGEELCQDNCESLGKYPIYGDPSKGYHIDTSCFAIPRALAVRLGPAWYGQYAADRQFFQNLIHHFPTMGCTGRHTVHYRLDGNPNSVTQEFFERGNALTKQHYGDSYPWEKPLGTLQKPSPIVSPNVSPSPSDTPSSSSN